MNVQEIQKQRAKERNIAKSFDIRHLKPQKGTSDYNYNTLIKIIVFTEDSKWGMDLLEKFFSINYKDSDITLVSVKGSGNFRYAYAIKEQEKFDYAIFIYDRGKASNDGKLTDNNRKELNKGIRKLKKERPETKLFVFSPISMEEILLSFNYLLSDYLLKYNLSNNVNIHLHNEYIQLLKRGIDNINYANYVSTYKSYENLIEGAIEDLTDNTHYKVLHQNSYVSSCWWERCYDCTNETAMCNKTNVKDYIMYSDEKMELLASHSLLSGLAYIVDKIYGYHYRKFPQLVNVESTYRNKLIQEV